MAGAEVRLSDDTASRSDDAGMARLVIGGREGDSFEIRVQCPPPLRSPSRPVVVRRLAVQGGEPEYAVKCEETRRTLIVAVRATIALPKGTKAPKNPESLDLAGLPILYLGTEVGRTDRSGAAHVKVDADTRERVALTLDTTRADLVDIHPQNPEFSFEPADHDEVRGLQGEFTRDAKKKPLRRGPTGPIRFGNN